MFVHKPAHALAMLSVDEVTYVALLRDLIIWAYERSKQKYLVIEPNLVETDPLKLAWRDVTKQTHCCPVKRMMKSPKPNAGAA